MKPKLYWAIVYHLDGESTTVFFTRTKVSCAQAVYQAQRYALNNPPNDCDFYVDATIASRTALALDEAAARRL